MAARSTQTMDLPVARRARLGGLRLSKASIAALALSAIILVLFALLFSYRVAPPPDNVRVIADDERMTYASTPCIVYNNLDRELISNRTEVSQPDKALQLMAYANERSIGELRADPRWKRDGQCNFVNGYDQIITRWMRVVGYRSRWTGDGGWNW